MYNQHTYSQAPQRNSSFSAGNYQGMSQSYQSFQRQGNSKQAHRQRMPPVAGIKLWGPKGNNIEKIIAPKYMNLRINLRPSQSSLMN
jgi:hypothetical protein